MKKLKKVVLALVLFFAVISLSGCIDKKTITADEFKNTMERKSYYVTDVTSQYSNEQYMEKVYVARNNDNKYQIEFVETTTEKDAIEVYDNNKNIFESSLGSVSKGKLVFNSQNVQKFRATSNGYYMVLTRKGNTMIYAKVPAEYTNEVANIIKDLGY